MGLVFGSQRFAGPQGHSLMLMLTESWKKLGSMDLDTGLSGKRETKLGRVNDRARTALGHFLQVFTRRYPLRSIPCPLEIL